MAIVDVVNAITATAELTGAHLSGPAIAVMAKDLMAAHGERAILGALERCRKELSRPLTAGAVFERLEQDDNSRVSSDEAWGIAVQSSDESETVVWNAEIQQAFAVAQPVLDLGDEVGARMAFRSAYERIVRTNRENGIRPEWQASLGWDKEKRVATLEMAQRRGLLPAPEITRLLPSPSGGVIETALFGGGSGDGGDESAKKWIAKLKGELKEAREERERRHEAIAEARRKELEDRKRRIAEIVAAETERRSVGGVSGGAS